MFKLLLPFLVIICSTFAHGQLNVQPVSQNDPRWTERFPDGDTIKHVGCAVCCITMVHQFFGDSIDPNGVMRTLTSQNAFTTGSANPLLNDLMLWSRTSFNGVNLVSSGAPFSAIDAELTAGNPVIVQVRYPNVGTHYVVITGKTGATYTIADPEGQTVLTPFYGTSAGNAIRQVVTYHSSRTGGGGGLSDGLYRASGESTVFLVTRGIRRAFNTSDCFIDWFGQGGWGRIKVVDPATLYGQTAWDQPIPHLVRNRGNGTVYWITESFNDGRAAGKLVARQINSAPIFDAMHFRWDDVRVVDYWPAPTTYWPYGRYAQGASLAEVEPRLITRDGPYCRFHDDAFWAGWRVRNLSDANYTGLAATVRIAHLNNSSQEDGIWMDFPWSGTGGIDKSLTEGWSPPWTGIWNGNLQPRGMWNIKVAYSLWSYGRNIMIRAYPDGEFPYVDGENRLGAGG